jgi:hypothetical protein
MADEILERWALIPGFSGAYSASTLGRVRREERVVDVRHGAKATIKEMILSPKKSSNGYFNICLRTAGVRNAYLVHRLVLLAFRGRPPENFVACHLNGRRDDNRLENLRWDTQSGNMRDKIAHGTSAHGERNNRAKLTAATVAAISMDTRRLHEISKEYGVTIATCSAIKNGKVWAHLGISAPHKHRSGRPDRKQIPAEIIRAIRADSRPQRKIAEEYGVQQQLVSKIKTGKVWGDVV